jgi:hypothetical protein
MTTFHQLCQQAGVTLASNGLYFAKEHRTCEAQARFNVAVRAMIDQAAADEAKHEREKARLAKANSELAARLAEAERAKANAEKATIRRGLEATDLPEVTRARIMSTTPNGE